MKNFKIILLVILAGTSICLNSCESLNDPGEMKYNNSVFLILRAGSPLQQLYVYNTLPLSYEFKDPPPFTNSDEVISTNASMTISDGTSNYSKFELAYTDTFKTRRCYQNIGPLNILSDKVYSICVQSNGQTIIGKVMTPGDFDILEVQKTEDDGFRSFFKITWTKCNRARFYTISAVYSGLFPFFLYYKDGKYVCDTVYSSRKTYPLPYGIDSLPDNSTYSYNLEIPAAADSAVFEVEAFDLATYNYMYKGLRKVNIENGIGLLGSSTVKYKKMKLK